MSGLTMRGRNKAVFGFTWSALAALAFLLVSHTALAQSPEAPVAVAELTGVINPLSADYLGRAIGEAERQHSAALVVVLDTPGGLDSSMRDMVQSILGSRVPIVVYVAPPGARAASAGLFVTMAAHVAAMAPGTNIGAAHPVALGGEASATVADKAVADAAAYIRALAETSGRNAEWAERAVRESVSVTSAEALQLGVIELVASDLSELLRLMDGRQVKTSAAAVVLKTASARTFTLSMNPIERLLHVITDPNIAFLLLSIGTIGLVAEFYHPGTVIPGVTGAIALLLAWAALGNLPTNWAGAALVALAFVLLIVETQTHGTGALSIAAAVSFVLGALLLFRPLGSVPPSAPAVALSPWVVGMAGITAAGFAILVVGALASVRRSRVVSGPEALVGSIGVAQGALRPHGILRIGAEDWTALAQGSAIEDGQQARVVRVEGVTLVVEPAAAAKVLPSASAAPSPAPSAKEDGDA